MGTLFPNYLIQEDMFAKEEIELWDLSGNQSHLHNKDIFTKALEDIKNKGIKVLLIDEVQRVDEYHKILIDFIVKNKVISIYVTGSNSDILSSDIINHFKEYAEPLFLRSLSYKEIKTNNNDYRY